MFLDVAQRFLISEAVDRCQKFEEPFSLGMCDFNEALGDTYYARRVVTFKIVVFAVEEPEIKLQEGRYRPDSYFRLWQFVVTVACERVKDSANKYTTFIVYNIKFIP